MKKTLRHIAVLSLASIVLVSSTGLSIHRLYCHCKGENTVSLFSDTLDCKAAAQAEGTCCAAANVCPAPSTCCAETPDGGRACDSEQHEYLRLDAEYLLLPLELKLQAPHPCPLAAWQYPVWASFSQPMLMMAVSPPSPMPSGSERLAFLQTFRC